MSLFQHAKGWTEAGQLKHPACLYGRQVAMFEEKFAEWRAEAARRKIGI